MASALPLVAAARSAGRDSGAAENRGRADADCGTKPGSHCAMGAASPKETRTAPARKARAGEVWHDPDVGRVVGHGELRDRRVTKGLQVSANERERIGGEPIALRGERRLADAHAELCVGFGAPGHDQRGPIATDRREVAGGVAFAAARRDRGAERADVELARGGGADERVQGNGRCAVARFSGPHREVGVAVGAQEDAERVAVDADGPGIAVSGLEECGDPAVEVGRGLGSLGAAPREQGGRGEAGEQSSNHDMAPTSWLTT